MLLSKKKVVRFTYFLGLTAGRVAREVFFAIPRADPQAGKMTSGGEKNLAGDGPRFERSFTNLLARKRGL